MTRTQCLNWMTLIAPSLCLAGCLRVESVPLVDAGPNTTEDTGTNEDAGDEDPSLHWPAVAHDFGREIGFVYPCESALVWSFVATRDSLGNRRNDEEVWVWQVGGTPQVLAAHLHFYSNPAGCHGGFVYWNESDGVAWSLHRRDISASAPAEFAHSDGPWTAGEGGRFTRMVPSVGVEVLDVDDMSVTAFPYEGIPSDSWLTEARATQDYLYIAYSRRIAYTPGAEWNILPGAPYMDFAPVSGRVIGTGWSGDETILWQISSDGTLLRLATSCLSGQSAVSQRGGWVVWNLASGGGSGCSDVGRSTVDENGNVHVQRFPELSAWADEMAVDATPTVPSPIRVLQFGSQIAFVNLVRGTIRLADEPAFPCVDPTVPCPPGGECATTLCADLPN